VISPEESREDGYFEIPAVRPGTYAIDIGRAGQPPRETAVTVVVAGANVGEIVVPLDPDPAPGEGRPGEGAAPDEAPRADRCSDGAVATITGEVRDALGRPAESVLVSARADHGAPAAASVLTSAQGGFVLRGVCGGPYRVAAYGLTTTTRASKAGVRPGDHVPLALGGLSTIVLRVRYGGRPSPEFFVALTGPVSRRERIEDADGEGRLRWLDPGSYELRVEGGDGLLVRAIDLEPNAVERIDLDLEKARQAAGARDAAPP
jgi:hypothetical protein